MYLIVYVYDLIVIGNNLKAIDRFIAKLGTGFSIKDLGSLAYFLGIQATRTSTGLFLSQRKYIEDIVQKASMVGANPVATPLAATNSLQPDDSAPISDPHDYRMLVGSLQYLALTRPDIAFSTTRLAQFSHRPTVKH